jgi:hypothetical protein
VDRLGEGSPGAIAVANELHAQIDKVPFGSKQEEKLLDAVREIAARLAIGSQEVTILIHDVLARTEYGAGGSSIGPVLVEPFRVLAERLAPDSPDTETLVSELRAKTIDSKTASDIRATYYYYYLGFVAERLPEGDTRIKTLAQDLATRIYQPSAFDPEVRRAQVDALGRIARRLPDHDPEAEILARQLLTPIDWPSNYYLGRSTQFEALGKIVDELPIGSPTVGELAQELMFRIENPQWDAGGGLRALSHVASRFSPASPQADKLALDLVVLLNKERFDMDSGTIEGLLLAFDQVVGRMAVGSPQVDKLSEILRSRLERGDDLDVWNQSVIALGSVAKRLKPGSRGGDDLTKFLRARVASAELDPSTRRALYDAVALIGGDLGTQPSDGARVVDVLRSIAYPLRDPWDSPAWPIVEHAAHRSFGKDVPAMMAWVTQTYGLPPDAARSKASH